MKKYFWLILIIISISSCTVNKQTSNHTNTSDIKNTVNNSSESQSATPTEESNKQNKELPNSVNLDMIFVPQAPFANWDQLHDAACEETSLLLVHYYLTGIKSVANESADADINKMVEWQIKNYGSHDDLTIEKLADFAKKYYNYQNIKIMNNATIDDIKQELVDGNPIIAPCAGRDLGNPYFRQPGPIYHMLVIKGYDSKFFITNDVGTKHGENYKYEYNKLYNAIHNFNGLSEEEIRNGAKTILIIKN